MPKRYSKEKEREREKGKKREEKKARNQEKERELISLYICRQSKVDIIFVS